MLTVTEYAISLLERGYRQRGPSVRVLADDPDFAIPSRVLVINGSAFAHHVPTLNGSGRAVMMDMPDDAFGTASTSPISISMALVDVEESVFLGLAVTQFDGEKIILPICPEEHPEVLTWMLRSDALVLGHTFPSMNDDEFSVNVIAAMPLSQPANLRMSMLLLHALNGWPLPSVN